MKNGNSIHIDSDRVVMFIDMNSFFASCEQQVNYWLRGRPVGVCVYTGKNGCIIAPSIEAKIKGVKTGVRLSEAIKICPELVPIETHPERYRKFHVEIMKILKKYADDVIPKSIDEAIINLTDYKYVYKNPTELAYKIKREIKENVGEWMKCSIGIAPNAFLAKLASNLQKPDGLVLINPQNIDAVLKKLKLEDLPGIASGMSLRLKSAGIYTPYQLRHTPPDEIRRACNSVVGQYWYYRLNFAEVDMMKSNAYKSIQSMRQISYKQRNSIQLLEALQMSLCLKLEERMVKQHVFGRSVFFILCYENKIQWKKKIKLTQPLQSGIELLNIFNDAIKKYEKNHQSGKLIGKNLTSMGVSVDDFIDSDMIPLHLFEDNTAKDFLRKVSYQINDKYGRDTVLRAAELSDEKILKDAIGFGSVKDL